MLHYFNPSVPTSIVNDPLLGYTPFLFSGTGPNGTSTFTDMNKGVYNSTPVAFGDAQIDASAGRFGGGALRFDGTGDYITATRPLISTGNFTIEFWINRQASMVGTGNWCVMDFRPGNSGDSPHFRFTNATNGVLDVTLAQGVRWAPTLAANTWYHLAVCRNGTTVRCFLNGTQVGSNYTSSANVNGEDLTLGTYVDQKNTNGNNKFNGWLQDIRITHYARYTSNFTPPTRLLPTKGKTVTSMAYIGFSSSTTATISIPAGAQPGDLAILHDGAYSTIYSIPAATIPANWSSLVNTTATLGHEGMRSIISVRSLSSADISAGSVTGMTGANSQGKIMFLYRPNNPTSALWLPDAFFGQGTSSVPSDQVNVPDSNWQLRGTNIIMGTACTSGTPAFNQSGSTWVVEQTAGRICAAHRTQRFAASFTARMADLGLNILQSGFVYIT